LIVEKKLEHDINHGCKQFIIFMPLLFEIHGHKKPMADAKLQRTYLATLVTCLPTTMGAVP
jgi:hypothetical protein